MTKENAKSVKISDVLSENMKIIEEKFKDCLDLMKKQVFLKDNTEAYYIYIDGIANPKLVQKLYDKVKGIKFDGILAAGYVE